MRCYESCCALHCTALVSAGSWRCASSARSSRCSWCATTIRLLRGTSSPSSSAVLCGRHSLCAVPHCSTYAEYPCSIAGTPPLFVYAATLTCVRRLCSTTAVAIDPLLPTSRAKRSAAVMLSCAAVGRAVWQGILQCVLHTVDQSTTAEQSATVSVRFTVCCRVRSQADHAPSPTAAAAALREAASCGVIACKVGAGMRCPPVDRQGKACAAAKGSY